MRRQKFTGNIFVANLPNGITDEQLAQAFDQFGIVIGAFLARDPTTGAPRTHGLVNIAPERVAAQAVAAMDGSEINGKKIKARLADPNMSLTIPTRPGGGPPRPSMRSGGHGEGGRPGFGARYGGSTRSFDDQDHGDRPSMERAAVDRPRPERPILERQPLERSPLDRPSLDLPPLDRPPLDRPLDRPLGEHARAERPLGERPLGERSFSMSRPAAGRPTFQVERRSLPRRV